MQKEIKLYPRIVYKDGQEDTTVHNGQEFGEYIDKGWQDKPLTNKRPLPQKTESAKIDLSEVNFKHAAEIAAVKSAHDAEISAQDAEIRRLVAEVEMQKHLYNGLAEEHEELQKKAAAETPEDGA